MAVPDYQSLMLPLLQKVEQKGDETFISELIDEIASELQLSDSDIGALVPSAGKRSFRIGCIGRRYICRGPG